MRHIRIMNRCQVLSALVVFCSGGVLIAAQEPPNSDADLEDVRKIWSELRHQRSCIAYEFTGSELIWNRDSDPSGPPKRNDVTAKGKVLCTEPAMSMEVTRNGTSQTVLLLSKGGFQKWARQGRDEPSVTKSQDTQPDSDEVYLLPLAIAHGIVPLDPLQSRQFCATEKGPLRGFRADPMVSQTQGRWEIALTTGQGHKVRIDSNPDGTVNELRLTVGDTVILRVRNTYTDRRNLESFSVIAFNDAGQTVRRLDGKITELQEVPQWTDLDFAPLRSREELEKLALDSLEKGFVPVAPTLTLEELAAGLEKAMGGKLPVRIAHEAFEPSYPPEKLNFRFSMESDYNVGSTLFQRLRITGLDFCFTHNGLVILPRNASWHLAEVREYHPQAYGLTGTEMRELLANATVQDDWDFFGGYATIEVDKDTDGVIVLQGQSDHLRFSHTLRGLLDDREDP